MKRRIKSAFTEKDGRGDPHTFDPDFRGPVKSRSCTDILCLLLFIVCVAGWVAVMIIALANGDPSRLIYPTDSQGQLCGRDEAVADKPFLFFFDLTRCASPKVAFTGCPTPQICVKQCPTDNWFFTGTKLNATYCKEGVDTNVQGTDATKLIYENKCAGYFISSKSFAGRCLPINFGEQSNELLNYIFQSNTNVSKAERLDTIVDAVKYASRFIKYEKLIDGVAEDIRNIWHILLLGCCVSMLVSFLWIVLLRLIARVMVWFSLVAFTALSALAAYYTMDRYLKSKGVDSVTELTNSNITERIFAEALGKAPDRETWWLVAFIATLIIFLICFIILIFLRKRIKIAIALINEASKAVASIMSSLFFPLIPFLLHIVVLVLFCGTTFMLASAGNAQYRVMCDSNDCSCASSPENSTCNPETFDTTNCDSTVKASCQFYSHMTDNNLQYLHIYNVFMLLWTMFFVSALAEFILAGAFSLWYWSFNKKDLPAAPIMMSTGTALRYHIGTVAFGSLIIAIVRGIRLIFEYIDHKVKQYHNSPLVKVLSCCCRCCLWCLEKFLRFINRNAYIYSAIYGTNFCTSARKSFSLLMRNILRVMSVDLVTDFLLFIGKLVVTGLMAMFTFFLFDGSIPWMSEKMPHVNYFLTPVVIITIATYFIAASFFNVYEMAVDTLFFCFLEDGERNDGSPEKPYFMSKELMQILDKSNKFQKKED